VLLAAEGLSCRLLPVPSPFHTPLLADTQAPLAQALSQEALLPPRVPLLSSVTNRYVADPLELRANLVQQMIEPVRYVQLIERLAHEGVNVFVEVGPQQVLTRLAKQILPGSNVSFLATDHPKRPADEMLLRLQAALEMAGVTPAVQPTATNLSHSVRELIAFDATTRRREQRRPAAKTPPTPAVSAIAEFDATSARRANKRLQPAALPPTAVDMAPAPVVPTNPVPPTTATGKTKLETFLVEFVVEQTGYPAEMIDLDWDMEADLGIDSIKRAQLFGELRELFTFEQAGNGSFSLDRFRTLRQVLEFLQSLPPTTSLPAPTTPVAAPVPEPKRNGHAATNVLPEKLATPEKNGKPSANGHAATQGNSAAQGDLETFLVRFVVEQTGYPPEIVELDADLEADLGIDSIKKAQLFGELREHFELPLERMGKLKIADYHTLRQVKEVLLAHLPTAALLPASPANSASAELPLAELDHSLEYERGIERGRNEAAPMHAWLRQRADTVPTASWWESTSVNRTLTEEHRGMAEGAQIAADNVLAYQEHYTPPQVATAPITAKPTAVDVTPSPETIASRYVLRMVAAPQPVNAPSQPTWHGAAVILGNNQVGQAIQARLAAEGCRAFLITPSQDPFGAAAELERLWQQGPICHLFIVTPRDAAAATTLDGVAWKNNREHGLLAPFWLCQRWLKLVGEANLMDRASLVATVSLGGDFGLSGNVVAAEGGAIGGLLKAIIIESWVNGHRTTPIKIVDAPVELPTTQMVEAIWRELAVPSYDCEIGLLQGRRHVIRAQREPLQPVQSPAIRRGEVWVCTGGARGITAFVAQELGTRFGLKLQLIGTAPVPNIPASWRNLSEAALKELKLQVMQQARGAGQNPIKSWQNTEKALEIDRTLREFAEQGIDARYYSCDVADRASLARVLETIRNEVGPIEGILHGAGVGKDARFERKEPEKVDQCFAAKIDGALALMDLTRRDPIKHFIAFGSISGRFGANGHTDYSAANDMLCKLIDWYRKQRPKTHAVAFHWHAWGDVGMATKPETKLALELVDMQFMPAREGLQHLLNELAAGTPEGEVLITDDRYHRMFYPAETLSTGVEQGTAAVAKYPLLANAVHTKHTSRELASLELDPLTEPFLIEHRLDDRPLLPVVVGMELLAEAAARAAGARVTALCNLQAVNGLRFFQDRAQTVQVSCAAGQANHYHCELTADFLSRDGKLIESQRPYLRADVEVSSQPVTLAATMNPMSSGEWQAVDYAARGAKFYLGPPLRALKQIKLGTQVLWGRIFPPMLQELAGTRRSADGWIVPSAALDACLYAVGLLAWMQIRPGPSLPFSFGRIALGRLPHPGEACVVEVKFLQQQDRYADFEFTLFGTSGDVILQVTDYRIVYLT
jgi:malonyl CoA-acyl carrier protein transacylase/NAD(P)-dependent dehydrogenase (short-subunit alcohol dehydrogenase family)